ncbi:PLDc N-terminal domain-containing protein [Leucobacter luti]|uniref:PLDc N-terminal domain-containing protein n=1 Tax=Leucobacter luti TaxID=340320 RepID=UPI003D0020F1
MTLPLLTTAPALSSQTPTPPAQYELFFIAWLAVLVGVGIMSLVALIQLCIDVPRHRGATAPVWALAILFVPVIGPIIYFSWRRRLPQRGRRPRA